VMIAVLPCSPGFMAGSKRLPPALEFDRAVRK